MSSNGVLSWNIRGLFPRSNKTKILYLRDLAIQQTPLYIVLTETHMTPDILDAEVSISGYTLYRSDRLGRTHGGTCAYVRSDLASTPLLAHSNSVCETLVVKVQTLGALLVSVYRPPDSSMSEFIEAINLCQTTITDALVKDAKITDILQLGDYNFPFLNEYWTNRTQFEAAQKERQKKASAKEQGDLLINFMEENFMDNFSLEPTIKSGNILDLVLCNSPALISRVTTSLSQHISDHAMLDISINHKYTKPKDKDPKEYPYSTKLHEYDLNNAKEEDWLRYSLLMNIEEEAFESIVEEMDVESKVETLYQILEKVVGLVFDKRKEFAEKDVRNPAKNNNKIPSEMRLLMKQKSQISERIKKSKSWIKSFNLFQELEANELELTQSYKKTKLKA